MTLYMMKGLPGSGKTTRARQLLDKNFNGIKRVNKDDLRAMMTNGKWSKETEKLVLKARDFIVEEVLSQGNHVVVDDTNLHEKHEQRLQELAKKHGAEFQVIDLSYVSVEECIANDLKRLHSVGSRVIKQMYNQFIAPRKPKKCQILDLPPAIICDIDGTLAIKGDRSPFDWDRVGEDKVKHAVWGILKLIREHTKNRIFLFSGRDAVCERETMKWLQINDVPYDELVMRPEGNMEKDSIIKERMFDEHIHGKYNVTFILDDRNQVVDMWRSLGITCFQVAEGDF